MFADLSGSVCYFVLDQCTSWRIVPVGIPVSSLAYLQRSKKIGIFYLR